jgi:fusion and transport protein UGO1
MNTQEYMDGSLRPYVSRPDFDLHYPIAFQPDIGIIDTATSHTISQSLPLVQSQSGSSRFFGSSGSGGNGVGIHGLGSRVVASAKSPLLSKDATFGKSVNDLEWSEFFDVANLKAIMITLATRFVQGWAKCLMSQPFDVVMVLLQVGSFKQRDSVTHKSKSKVATRNIDRVDSIAGSETESDSEIEGREAYFVDSADDEVLYEPDAERMEDDNTLRSSQIERHSSRRPSRSLNITDTSTGDAKVSKKMNILIEPESLNTFDMISSLLVKEGPRGILKAVNTTFLLHTLQYTIESWVTGFLSGMIGIPDPLYVDIIHSPNANWSLILSVFSNVFTSLILTQIKLIRTKFIITTSSRGCRSFREIIWNVPRFYLFSIPKGLLIPSLITNFVKSFTFHYPDYLLASMRINKYNNAYVYNMSSVVLKIVGLFVRLPFETLYARAQVNYLLTNKDELPEVMRVDKDDMCIEFGGYYGYLSTLYYILMGSRPLTYEGQSLEVDVDEAEVNRGIQAVFRGWKVGLIRLLSTYTLSMLNDDRLNIREEKF